MRGLAGAAALGVILTMMTAPASAAAGCSQESKEDCPKGQTTDSGFGVTVTETGHGQQAGAAPGSGSTGAAGPVIRRETRVAPTCTGNSVHDSGVLCSAAVETCPVEGEVRFWKWQRTFNNTTDEWGTWKLVDTVCLGPDEPMVDPTVAIPAIVQRDFQSVVVVKGAADVTPKPDTLINVATKFRTDAPASYEIPLSILGQSVVITARAEKYTWHFGDGESAVSRAADGYIEHTYRKAATEQAHVVITWSGTFTVNGGASQAINGTVSTTGNPVDVRVREARSELVRD